MPTYQPKPMMSPRGGTAAADSSLRVVMGEGPRQPLTPRRDKPQVNVRHFESHSEQVAKTPKSSKSSKKKHRKQKTPIDEMDEASKEAHIVQKIEMAIKKSRSERKASSRSHSLTRSKRSADPSTPARRHRRYCEESDIVDENYEMIKTDDDHHLKIKPKRSKSNTSKVRRHKAKPQLEAPKLERESSKYKSSLIEVDDYIDEISDMDCLVDDKRGFQIDVEETWITTTFSDPTLDTYENNHFFGQDKQALAMLDPQRIQCGPAKSSAQSSSSGNSPDPVTSIIDRINEKKEQFGNTYPRKKDKNSDQDELPKPKTSAGGVSKQVPNELISFDHYEDDDGYYYEDDEDDYPIYPSSRPPPPVPLQVPFSMKFPSLMPPFQRGVKSISKSKQKKREAFFDGVRDDDNNVLQSQVDDINQLHRDIQRQQDLIKQFSQLSTVDKHLSLNPHETSAEVYHRELARQAQAELQRLELVQKSAMLDKQMEIFRRNQEEWNKVRDMAIKEEESRRKMAEKAKEVWQAEVRAQLGDDDVDAPLVTIAGKASRELSAIEEKEHESRGSRSSGDSSGALSQGRSLYHKVAYLNNRADITDEDQKIIEAEILKELHMELSKQAADKKLMQKPKFFSERMRSSWSGKPYYNGEDHNKPVEQLTEELTQKIHDLNLEMSPNKISLGRGKSRRIFNKAGKSKTKGQEFQPRSYEGHHAVERDDADDRDGYGDEDRDSYQPSDSTPKKKKPLLRALRLRKNKGTQDLSARRSSEITPQRKPRPIARTIVEMVSPKHSSKRSKGFDVAEASEHSLNQYEEPKMSDSMPSSSTSSKQTPSQRLPTATSSQSTQLTSNKVFIGVDGDAIEAMSLSSKNAMSVSAIDRDTSSVLSKDPSCDSRDRYTTCSGEAIVTSGSKQVPTTNKTATTTKKKSEDDEPSIFEFLEVQYYPHDDELEAPLDEMEADAHSRSEC